MLSLEYLETEFRKEYINKYERSDYDRLFHEYLKFSQFIQRIFLKPDSYITDTGNFETANLALIPIIFKKIKKHPLIWKMFFMY